MNKKTKSTTLILLAILIILMTELIEINSNIFSYYRIMILIPALYYFVNKLKDKTNLKTSIITAVLLVVATIGLTYLIGYKFNEIIAVSLFILAMNVSKIEHIGFNKDCIKKFVIYYIVPYILLYVTLIIYNKIVSQFSVSYKFVAIPLFQNASSIISLIVRTNVSLLLFGILFKDLIDSKISIGIRSIIILIVYTIILIALLVNKNTYLVNGINEIDEKIKKIDTVMESVDIKDYKSFDLNPRLQLDTAYEISREIEKELKNYNKRLLILDNHYNEEIYKLEKSNLDYKYKKKNISLYMAIRDYRANLKTYSDNFKITKDNANMQRVSHFVIYFIDLACFIIAYHKVIKDNKKKYDLMKKEQETALDRMRKLQNEAINNTIEKEKEEEKEEEPKADYGGYQF